MGYCAARAFPRLSRRALTYFVFKLLRPRRSFIHTLTHCTCNHCRHRTGGHQSGHRTEASGFASEGKSSIPGFRNRLRDQPVRGSESAVAGYREGGTNGGAEL
ncbi:hypothetical protein FIBSPDRAFT_270516 [Athelia psychrophila]|uniref:Uncharacterized protein n=1 Tax=Athelia psychrophila TaxID=1759441 RepID=A0A165WZV9_9AGAM|nr:hypothetical protein FIBSPDRAFT_270516 [Fibularhizoctonia sp. CBS 109695]